MNRDGPGGRAGIRHGQGTDRGLKRQLNEDSLFVADALFAVADGMGGHEAGEVASRLCVETLAAGYRKAAGRLDAEAIHVLLRAADEAIAAGAPRGAGTTISGAAVIERDSGLHWLVFNVGDSRTYRLSDGLLEQVTVDHSEVQQLVERGVIGVDQMAAHPRRHVITRALGAGGDGRADFWLLPIRPGDRLLICSDGLSTELSDASLRDTMTRFPDPQQAADELIAAALGRGGRDNISVIIADAMGLEADEMLDTVPRPIRPAMQTKTQPTAVAGGATAPMEEKS
ncbi:PP2C family protein-serine/threonine phosphatase [Paeniglutamicibacter sp. MACA_103]|uniref:PP2C family protein-serine/threonine phosphatase n=1 Tax=Paeniglutamicibacter sp. MACA_103 TaxID=3377337 RepID=UPI003895B5DA